MCGSLSRPNFYHPSLGRSHGRPCFYHHRFRTFTISDRTGLGLQNPCQALQSKSSSRETRNKSHRSKTRTGAPRRLTPDPLLAQRKHLRSPLSPLIRVSEPQRSPLRSLVQSGGVPLAPSQAQPAERFRVEDAVHERAGGVGEDVGALGGGVSERGEGRQRVRAGASG